MPYSFDFFPGYDKRSRRNIWMILAVSVLLLIVSVLPLWGQSLAGSAPPLSESLAGFFQRVITPVLTALLMGLVSVLVAYLSKKLKTDILYKNNELIDKAVLAGIAYAEEQAYKAVKNSGKINGSGKMKLAVSYILEQIPSLTQEQVERLVESLLARVKGAGASGDLSLTAK